MKEVDEQVVCQNSGKQKQQKQCELCEISKQQEQCELYEISKQQEQCDLNKSPQSRTPQEKNYTLRATTTPLPSVANPASPCERKDRDTDEQKSSNSSYDQSFLRAANEDDDGYDPFSDLPPARPPLFEEDPWN